MGRARWHVDSNGQLSARVHGLKLIVCKFDACARYLIVQSATQGRPSTGIMLASGTEPSVDAAMMAAERVARRFEPTLAKQSRSSLGETSRFDRGVRQF